MENLVIEVIVTIAKDAGESILDIYDTDFSIEDKEDMSPLTAADKASHQMICDRLKEIYPYIPILSEEGRDISYEERKNWDLFWLVDPLDGTKEFIKRNGDFTVNIALIEKGYPVLGVIYVPVLDVMYVGTRDSGAYKIDERGNKVTIKANQEVKDRITMVESRSHPSKELEIFINELEKTYKSIERIQKGSSLKLCAVAEGTADIYPRLGPTMEWDTAAGQAIVESAGGTVTTLDGARFRYNKPSLLNDYFIVTGTS